MNRRVVGASAAVALLIIGGVLAADGLESGPQVGQNGRPMPFNPLHCNGPDNGKKVCLVWKNGDNPVAMIFAREVSPALTSLVKKIDAETVKNSGKKMGSFVVFLNDNPDLEKQLKEVADKEKLEKMVLAIDNPAGPKAYKVAQEADITVVLYNKSKVQANYAFKKGQLKDADIDKILADIPKIIP